MCDKTFMLVDDDDVLRSYLARALEKRGFRTVSAANCAEAARVLETEAPDMAVVDLRMPECSGLEVLETIQSRSPKTKSIVLTGYGSIANAVEAMRLGAINYITKPANADEVLEAFETDGQPRDVTPDFRRPSLAETEWNHIQKVLADCSGNITHAAKVLEIPRRTLQRKLKKLSP